MAIFSHFWSFLANCSYFCHFWSICPLGNFWAILAIFVLISFSLFFSGWFKHENRILPTMRWIDGFCLRRLQKSTPKFNWESRQAKSCAKNVRIYFGHFCWLLAIFGHIWSLLASFSQHFGQLWPLLAISCHFWTLLAFFAHFGANFGHVWPILLLFVATFGHFWPLLATLMK